MYSLTTRLNRFRSTARRIFFRDVTKPMRWLEFPLVSLAKTKKSLVLDLASGLSNTASKSLRDGIEMTVILRSA